MNCKQVQKSFADYLTLDRHDQARLEIESHLAGCAACREEMAGLQGLWTKLSLLPEVHPSPASTKRFEAMLEAYGQGLKQARRETPPLAALGTWLTRLWPRQPALQFALAMALFAAGLTFGILSPRLGNTATARQTGDPVVAHLRDEVSDLKKVVLLALLEQPSTSERLRGVAWANQLEQPGDQVLSALLRSLDSDPNVNVRLAVVDVLRPFAAQAVVRSALVQALADQTSPLVQVELINVLVELKAKDSIPRLKELLQRPELNPTVRERAEWGLENLS